MRHQTLLAQLSSLRITLERVSNQVKTYEQRRDVLQDQLQTTDNPIPGLLAELETKLSERQVLEQQLTLAREELRLTRMGVRVASDASEPANSVVVTEVTLQLRARHMLQRRVWLAVLKWQPFTPQPMPQ